MRVRDGVIGIIEEIAVMSGESFASRRLFLDQGGASVELTVEQPRKVSDDEWECTLVCEGEVSLTEKFFGIDSIQALTNALDGAAIISREKLSGYKWGGSDDEPDAGFRRIVPSFFGSELAHRVEALIDQIFQVRAEVIIRNRDKNSGSEDANSGNQQH